MSPTPDDTAKKEVVLALFGALEELRRLEDDILTALTWLTAPEDLLRPPEVYPVFTNPKAWRASDDTPARH